MAVDIEGMLHRVVADEFGTDTEVQHSTDAGKYPLHRARITCADGRPTDVELGVGSTRISAWIYELDVGYVELEEDDDEAKLESSLRTCAKILHAFANGEGRIEYRSAFIRRQRRRYFIVEVDGMEYRLGRRTARVGASSSQSK